MARIFYADAGTRHFAAAAVIILLCTLAASPAHAQHQEEEVNNGQDITKPVQRFDLRYQYQDLWPPANDALHIFTLRFDKPFVLGPQWRASVRFDLPLNYTNALSSDNPGGAYRFGSGDFLAQGLLIHIIDQRWALAGGVQLTFPTGSVNSTTSAAYHLLPIGAVRIGLPEISPGSFFVGLVRYDFDYAGRAGRTRKSELAFAPILNVNLPDRWFVSLFPSADIRVNLTGKRPGDTGRIFFPFNALAGKMVHALDRELARDRRSDRQRLQAVRL